MFRAATADDLLALTELERDANLAALGHVFAPAEHPFPFEDVLARWRLVLDDPEAVVLVKDRADGAGLAACVGHDARSVRHLAVHPTHWGQGLATAAVEIAVTAIREAGTTTASLWVLRENHRARRLYSHLGWTPTGEEQEAVWPPYPVELRYRRVLCRDAPPDEPVASPT